MSLALTIRDESRPGRTVQELTLPDLPERITLRDLIRTRVREEVAKVNADPSREFRTLVQPTDAETSLNGFRLRRPRPVDWAAQAEVAEEAFTRNGFFVLVDGTQATDLDAELELTAESDVRFMKLTPLVGG